MQLTEEQKAVLATDMNLVINAVAGSGKTTTLIEYAKSRKADSKILYLAFNKTVKTEAAEKFHSVNLKNVRVETAHSLAYEYIVRQGQYEVVSGYKSHEWCDILGIRTGDRHTDFIVAGHVNKFINLFCNSQVSKVQELNYANSISDAKAKAFVNNFYARIENFTREALAKMDKGEIGVIHDFYLKKFQLSNPVLGYDYILFDEGQDASPAMLDVFLKQSAVKIIVGDVHQQIYAWRYAINSLQKVNFKVFHLSHSFRFDEEIALIANKILAWKAHLLQPPAVKIVGAGNPSGLCVTRATLGRTNVSLLLNAIAQWQHGKINKLYFEGNINSYTFADEGASLYDVLHLYNGNSSKIKDKLIAEMKSMTDLEDYIQKTEDNSLAIIVEVVKEFGNRLPGLISELKQHHTSVKEEADMIFTTVHRCKGMEYDEVTLLNDFITEEKLKRYVKEQREDKLDEMTRNRLAEEVNILYVAATRAKEKLAIPPEINPLKSIQLAASVSISMHVPELRYSRRSASYRDRYNRDIMEFEQRNTYSQLINHGKKWTDEEQNQIIELYHARHSLKDIAKVLGRGENGVRFKLKDLGLLSDENGFE